MSARNPAHSFGSNPVPRWVGAHAELVIAARGDPARLKRVFDRSPVPMLLVDGERRYLDANPPAQLAFRQSVEELRRLRIEDLTPEYFLPTLEATWARLIETGCTAGPYDIGSPVGTHLNVIYYALADALPGQHLVAFAPTGPGGEDLINFDLPEPDEGSPLTPRELQVIELAAEGANAPMIAEELVVSTWTVRTHLKNIYAKLEVSDRAAAVAKAMRLGLIW